MLFGEHAVLRGGPAIVAAIECRLSVTITPRSDDSIDVQSVLGSCVTTIHELSFGNKFRFVEEAFRQFRSKLPCGLSVAIASSIDPTVGLASSASVTVALLAALKRWIDGSFDRHELLSECCSVIRAVQGYGSGADAASIIYGGVIAYEMDNLACTPLTPTLPLVLIYSGKKTPTPEVIRYVLERESRFPVIYKDIFCAINDVTAEAILAGKARDLPLLGQLMNQAGGLMEALDVGTPELSNLCWKLRSESTIFGAKISGSGLGDAVIGLGVASQMDSGRRLVSTVSTQGVEVTEWKK